MQSRYHDFQTLKTDIVGICVDPPEANAKVVAKLDLTYPILSDPDLKVIDAFGLRHDNGLMGKDIARPAVFILDKEGRVLWKDLTANYRVRVKPGTLIDVIGAATSKS